MSRTSFLIVTVAILTLGFGAAPARADGSFSLTAQGTTNDALLGKVINVEGQSKPIVTVVPGFSGSFMGYDKMELRINGSFKNAWENTANATAFSPNSYGWDLCAGNDTSVRGAYTLVLNGIDAFSTSHQVASDQINVKGTYNCNGGGNQTAGSISISAGFSGSNDKTVEVSLYLTDITESELCSTYAVQLKLVSPDVQKDNFCTPASPNIKTAVWNTTNTPKGTYQLYAAGLNQRGGLNIKSAPVSIEIKDNGVVDIVGGDGGTGGGAGGGNSVDLNPLHFTVPDSSRLKGKYGIDLFIELRGIIYDYLVLVVSILAVVAVIISGLMYIFAYGDPAKAEKAKKNLQWAIYGIVVVVLSMVVLTIIGRLLHSAV